MTYDSIVSRYLNRPVGKPVARALAATPATPNTLTSLTLLMAIATAAMLAAGWNLAGGIAIQAVSMAGDLQGELIRLRNAATRFETVFAAVAERYTDALLLGGMTIYAVRFEDLPRAEVVGALALAGALVVSYSRARIEADIPEALEGRSLDSIFGLASRDARLLLAALGVVAGQCYWTLVILAVLSAATVAWRLAYLRAKGIGGPTRPPSA